MARVIDSKVVPSDREIALEDALVRMLTGLGEPLPKGLDMTCDPYDGLLGDAIGEAKDALTMPLGR